MKNSTLLCSIALITLFPGFVFRATAQITLTQSDLPSAGLKVVTATDSTSGLLPGSALNSAQNWDFSSLAKQKIATIGFITPGSTPYAGKFSAANLADSTYGESGYVFFTSNPDSFSVEGAEETLTYETYTEQAEINLNPLFEQTALPATYGDIISGIARGGQTFYQNLILYDSIKVSLTIIYNDTMDAFGTMKMPSGETYNVLRQNHTETDFDSISLQYTGGDWRYISDTITKIHEYNWYAKGLGYVLAQMNMDTTSSTVKNIIWDTSAPAPLAINEISNKNSADVYPNPASAEVTFKITGNTDHCIISVFDVMGRLTDRVPVKNNIVSLNTSGYPNGVYLYNLTDYAGNLLEQGKFAVQH